jgi:protein-disulfide isomerase
VRFLLCGVALVASVQAPAGVPQVSAQGITAEQADAILRELREIKQLLERHVTPAAEARPETVRLDIDRTVSAMGRADAPITVVEFTDLECPFCRQFHATTFEQIKKEFIDTGKVRFVSRDFPLDFHKHAEPAAHAVRCAGEQNRYWEMRHRVMTHATLDAGALGDVAAAIGLELDRFRECQRSGKYRAAIAQDIHDALGIGVSGTPTFVIGRTTAKGVEGERVVGAVPYEVFEEKLNTLLGPSPR